MQAPQCEHYACRDDPLSRFLVKKERNGLRSRMDASLQVHEINPPSFVRECFAKTGQTRLQRNSTIPLSAVYAFALQCDQPCWNIGVPDGTQRGCRLKKRGRRYCYRGALRPVVYARLRTLSDSAGLYICNFTVYEIMAFRSMAGYICLHLIDK